MRILIISFYFPPDLSACSFRMGGLVDVLPERMGEEVEIDILTTQPHRYASFKEQAAVTEQRGRISIRRFGIPAHKGGMKDQALSFLSFYRAVGEAVRDRHYDLVFATSSRLMTAFLGARIARRLGAPLYLDIRDIFVDTIGDVLPGMKGRLLAPFFSLVEKHTMRSARRINLVSEGFRDYFQSRYPQVPLGFITNGIDDEFLGIDWSAGRTAVAASAPIKVLYAGNIGEGQGLHRILPGLAEACGDRYQFIVVGDGGRKAALAESVAGLPNVRMADPVNRVGLLKLYGEADVLFLHLNDYPAFAKVLPSKIFEYAATGRPILAGVGGYAARFLTGEVENAGVFAPCQVQEGKAALERLRIGHTDRRAFIDRYARRSVSARLAEDILAQARGGPS